MIYTERTKVLEGLDMRSNIFGMVEEELAELIKGHLPPRHEEAWDRELLLEDLLAIYPVSEETKGLIENSHSAEEIEAAVLDDAEEAYDRREEEITPDNMRLLERLLLLQTIDRLWVEHLTAMDEMRQGIGLQAYGNQDPLVSYKREAHDMWQQLLGNIRDTIARAIYHVNLSQTPVQQQAPASAPTPARVPVGVGTGTPQNLRENRSEEAAVPAARQNGRKIGRNDPCYCGSGKKYKRCHGVAA